MKSIVTYFIKYPIAANLLMVAIALLGALGLKNMQSTFFPEQKELFISIRTTWPGASPQEVEEGIIKKIEENLKGVSGIDRITSNSVENSGFVLVEIAKGYNIDKVLRDVKNTVDGITSFPADMEAPIVFKNEILDFAISFAISGDVDLKTLKKYGRQAEEDLRAMPGISKISLGGFPDEEIEIAFREDDLERYKLTFAQATQAIRSFNLELSGGTIKGPKEELLIRARNKKYYADDLRDIVVKTNADGSVVYLHQVANVRDRWADPGSNASVSTGGPGASDQFIGSSNRTYLNGHPSVVVSVQTTRAEDLLSAVEKVKAYIQQFNANNEVVQATIIRDQSISLQSRIDLMKKNGLLGFFLVLLLLAMFLNWRLAFWVAISIPISFAGMFIIANQIGLTINAISLFGMIMVLGILVDDGIVISESIYQKYERGASRFEAGISGTLEVLPAVFGGVLTTMVAFSAFYFVDGRVGDFFSDVATVVIFSLLFSLMEGAFILPAHVAHSAALKPGKKKNIVTEKLDNFMVWMRDKLYAPTLRFCMHHKALAFSMIMATLIITIGAIRGGVIQTTFFPNIETDNITVSLTMPAGTPESVTTMWLSKIEEAAWRANERLSDRYFDGKKQAFLKIQKNIGPRINEGQLNVILLDSENRDSLSTRIAAGAIRDEMGPIYEAESVTYSGGGTFGKPVSISLVSHNSEELEAAAAEIRATLQGLKDLKDITDTNQEGLREVHIELKDKAKYLGLNLLEVIGQVRAGFFGSEVQRLQRGRDEVRVWVRYGDSNRAQISDLENMRVRFLDGREFFLHEIADLSIRRGIIAINHMDGKREIKVEADISRDDISVSGLTQVLKDSIVPPVLKKYATVQALFEGQSRESAKTGASFQKVIPIVLLVMFFIIALTFRSISQTLMVFSMIPFAIVGIGWGHYLMGYPISMLSNLGSLALIGILVNDALVFVTTYNQNLQDGQPQMTALYNAGLSRFRPIILTSVTTVAGLGPLMLEKSFQAQFLIPMAISVAFGLMFVTIVTLIFLPVLLIAANRFKVGASWLWNGKKPTYEAVEPATPEPGGYQYLWYLTAGVIAFAIFLSKIL
ncbi:MAG: efflux RND transporter permease subunit [Bacteroidetes bacterium]|nr:MAG: efflux RND transporter permease subunit [Bacteroidota bacterium]